MAKNRKNPKLKKKEKETHVQATPIPNGPTRLFALKLTTFKKNARTPFRNNHQHDALIASNLTFAFAFTSGEEEAAGGAERCIHTLCSSPVKYARSVVCIKAKGERRYKRCSGGNDNVGRRDEEVEVGPVGSCRCFEVGDERRERVMFASDSTKLMLVGEDAGEGTKGVWRRFVRIVFSAARTVPRSVRKKPHGVK